MPLHKAFFGDAERQFRLTAPMIRELERKTGAGIGALIRRVIARDFFHADLVETIRLALIVGGANPAEAFSLVNAYVIDRPLTETYALALAILENLFAGDAPIEIEPVETEKESDDNEQN
jgi:hypothetical protein